MLISRIYPVTCHTDHVGVGSTFVAIKGFKDDGTRYIQTAIERGARKIIVQHDALSPFIQKLCADNQIELIAVDNTRAALAEHASAALDNPAAKLKIIGITGTKGKTTTTYIIDHILRKAGHKTALIGSIKNKILDQEVTSELTTPESDYLHMFFAECVKNGVEYVVMEVASHALSLNRVHGIQFDAVGFTNLAPEHMDFYKDLEEYFAAKAILFSYAKDNAPIIINTDDDWGKKAIALQTSSHIFGFGQQNNNQAYVFNLKQNTLDGLRLVLAGQGAHEFPSGARGEEPEGRLEPCAAQKPLDLHASKLFGEFNSYNLVMATLVCKQLGIAEAEIREAIEYFHGVPGRLQLHTLKNGAKAFVDYAHNPSSFHEVLKTLRTISKHLIVVFGCGGDRDKTKRPVMGALAAQFGDKVIVTDDNPRTEPSDVIIQEILHGIPAEKQPIIICQPDRRKAIKTAATLAEKDSVIALLGKGHEPYYIINGQTLHFDDMEEIKHY